MTPKEKAEELYKKFQQHAMYWDCYNDEALEEDHAKQCALICVEEILNTSPIVHNDEIPVGLKPHEYWQQVKTEIEKL